jgi:hypothetical protein
VEYIELEKKILRGKELFGEIIRLVSDFLDRFDDMSPADIQAFELKRRELLEVIIRFQSDFRSQLSDEQSELPLEMTKKLEELRIFQEVFVQIITEKGAEIVARATALKDRLRGDMAILTSGKKALRGYGGKRGDSTCSLNKTV